MNGVLKKSLAILMAFILVFSIGIAAFAAPNENANKDGSEVQLQGSQQGLSPAVNGPLVYSATSSVQSATGTSPNQKTQARLFWLNGEDLLVALIASLKEVTQVSYEGEIFDASLLEIKIAADGTFPLVINDTEYSVPDELKDKDAHWVVVNLGPQTLKTPFAFGIKTTAGGFDAWGKDALNVNITSTLQVYHQYGNTAALLDMYQSGQLTNNTYSVHPEYVVDGKTYILKSIKREINTITDYPSLTDLVNDNLSGTVQNSSSVKITFIYEESTGYIVEYEKADGTKLSPDKTVADQTIGAEVTENAIEISGYAPDAATKKLTLGASDNVMTFIYTPVKVSFIVKYLESLTNKVLHDSKTGEGDFGTEVTETAIDITGYNKLDPTSITRVLDLSENIISFFYTAVVNPPVEKHKLTINYKYANGNTACESHIEDLNEGIAYDVASPAIAGYTADKLTVEGTMATADVTVDVTYTPVTVSYTVNYLESGSEKVLNTSKTGAGLFGAEITEAAVSIPGYNAVAPTSITKTLVVEGNIFNFFYTAVVNPPVEKHKLTINYKYANGDAAAESHAEDLNEGTSYSVTSPTITGYTADKLTVEGTMATADVTVDVTYTPVVNPPMEKHKLTINYKYVGGNTACESHIEDLNEGAAYEVASPAISGYNADKLTVAGTMSTADITVDVTYTPVKISYIVNYLESLTNKVLHDSKTGEGDFGTEVTETAIDIAGYNKLDPTSITRVLDLTENIISFFYTAVENPPVEKHKLTINYKYANGNTACESHIEDLNEGAAYDVASPAIAGYTADKLTVEGTMSTADVTVDVIYTPVTISYTVNYLESGSDKVLHASKTGAGLFGAEITEAAVSIPGYNAVAPTSITKTLAIEGNVFNFYYTVVVNPPHNPPSTPTTPAGKPDLKVTKTDNGAVVSPGALVEYLIVVENKGNAQAEGVKVYETLPEGAVYPADKNQGWVSENGKYVYDLGLLNVGEKKEIKFVLQIANPFPDGMDKIINSVEVKDNGTETATSDNNASDDTPILKAQALVEEPVVVLPSTPPVVPAQDKPVVEPKPQPVPDLPFTGGVAAVEILAMGLGLSLASAGIILRRK